ncbi:hypothetical protein [Halococcus saccharolyticus]|uniref:Nickel/cobalt efflux system n=1 Tax=Halococcus saccharolyticus DSM 5350 TaxID=1227455 RepID=M0MNM8_9EURY|nr:hypothetical protein [Halococcus saccharolyticus]EMA46968.1 hypothetical protein C449_03009 [Halococcus saccharolyticus DSM 5350]
MAGGEPFALFLGATVLGLIHGAEPGHGWPIAAAHALNRSNKWWSGFVASSLLGLGHLVSSLAVVAVFFLAKSYFDLTQINDPVSVLGVQIGGPVSLVAGCLLILLGIREYSSGHGHDHTHDHGHNHDQHEHHEDHHHHEDDRHDHGDAETSGVTERVKRVFRGGGHSHDRSSIEGDGAQNLSGIVWTAFVLGFAHEEEFEIIGLCLGSDRCLELMMTYALAVLVALVGLTMVLIAGYQQYEERMEGVAEYFPLFSAVVLVTMGVGFVLGVL